LKVGSPLAVPVAPIEEVSVTQSVVGRTMRIAGTGSGTDWDCTIQESNALSGSGYICVAFNDTIGNQNLNASFCAEVIVDTCSCPGIDTNWEINMGDYCNITTDCDIGTGILNFTGVGTTRCNATINQGTFRPPINESQLLEVLEDCYINITV